MALRLILVGVVASLALDLPRGDVRPVATRAIRSMLVAEPARPASSGSALPLLASEPAALDAPTPVASVATIKPTPVIVTLAPSAPVHAPLPIADPATVPSPLPAELAFLPILEVPAPAPPVTPMPAAPALEVASTPVNPVAETVPGPAPLPTVAVVDPMSPPPSIGFDESPEAAPAPASSVVETETAAPADPDAAFRKIVSSMASSFAADVAKANPTTEPKPLLAQVATPAVAAPLLPPRRSPALIPRWPSTLAWPRPWTRRPMARCLLLRQRLARSPWLRRSPSPRGPSACRMPSN